MIIILILILILIYLNVDHNDFKETYMVYWSGGPVSDIGYENIQNCPFWNSRVGQTRNMSYDLRGDPIKIPKQSFMWNNSTLTPIYNKSLC